jgi:hypothetical protein
MKLKFSRVISETSSELPGFPKTSLLSESFTFEGHLYNSIYSDKRLASFYTFVKNKEKEPAEIK